ncbi:MAG: PrsW family intramembrane metalloprotease [Erysipelotrichia bacterium]|nr:PrsW family intramembrane metalloprotease [Erysipelotrichia bacterium]
MIVLLSPGITTTLVYILAAILPAVLLMRCIYNQDKYEKEPPALLWKLILGGVLAALAAIVLEYLMLDFVMPMFTYRDAISYSIYEAIMVGAVEEGCKFYFLKRYTWNNPNFNYRYDGVVYAVFCSLGFAAFENIQYVFSYGLSVAFSRALLAIPAHMGFAVFMGAFYGRAKVCEVQRNDRSRTSNLFLGYLSAVCLHAFYDATAMVGTSAAAVMFIVFVILMYIIVFRKVKHESQSDRQIY